MRIDLVNRHIHIYIYILTIWDLGIEQALYHSNCRVTIENLGSTTGTVHEFHCGTNQGSATSWYHI